MDFLEEVTFREAWLFMHRPYDINEQAQPNTENELWFKMLAAPLEGVNIFIADDRPCGHLLFSIQVLHMCF